MDNRKRIYAFDAVKFLAAVCLIFHHYQTVLNVQFSRVNFYNGKFYFGYLVELFFIISGFLAYNSISRIGDGETFSAFFKKRCIRLLPVNILAATAHLAVIYVMFRGFHIWGWVISSFGLIALDESFANFGVNPPSWYVSVLLICSIWFYILTWLSKKKQLPLGWIYAAMVLLGLLIQQKAYSVPLFNMNTGRGYFGFFIGLLLRHFLERRGTSRKLLITAAVFLVGFVLIYCFRPLLVSEGFPYLLTLFAYPSLVILCTAPVCQKIFCHRWVSILGEVSFGMYLIHTPILFLLSHLKSTSMPWLPVESRLCMILVAAGTILLSFAVLYLVEKPAARFLKNLPE